MRPISKGVKEQLLELPQVCVLTGDKNIVWHHALIYRNRQIDKWYAIQFLREDLHNCQRPEMWAEMVAISKGILHGLATDYPKYDWGQRLKYLKSELGIW